MVYLPNPIILLLPVLVIPILYSALRKRENLKDIVILSAFVVLLTLLYPINYLPETLDTLGYLFKKLILFVIIPIVAIFVIERQSLKEIFVNAGVRKQNLGKSIAYGLAVTIITVAITVLVAITHKIDVLWSVLMFLEAFNEEFLFRGVLLLYLAKKTNFKIAYATSVIGFILIHPQHFDNMFILSTISQAVLLAIVARKTKNIIGPWVSHGLNRIIPQVIRTLIGI